MRMPEKTKRRKIKNFWPKFFTYAFLIILSAIIIYPLLITITSAFRSGNLMAFDLNFEGEFTLNNFRRLFSETLYGTWYLNTLKVALTAMVIQVSIITLAGYAYSRYRFLGKK